VCETEKFGTLPNPEPRKLLDNRFFGLSAKGQIPL
jgi:hypothetical protein